MEQSPEVVLDTQHRNVETKLVRRQSARASRPTSIGPLQSTSANLGRTGPESIGCRPARLPDREAASSQQAQSGGRQAFETEVTAATREISGHARRGRGLNHSNWS